MIRNNNTLEGILDIYTKEPVTYDKVTTWLDGSPMDDSKCDSIIYRKAGSEYFKRNFVGRVNAKWFGARGDGSADDYPALAAAILYTKRIQGELYIPSGTYLLTTGSTANETFTVIGGDYQPKFSMIGEEGTVFRVNKTVSHTIMYFYYGFTNLTIKNISFENTHGITLNQTNAIAFINGGSGAQLNKTPFIQNCKFQGFSTALAINGSDRLTIDSCKFYAPLGHDNAQNNTDPAVYIWFNSNGNGINILPTVSNCYAEGYSGTNLMGTTTQKAMDGFLYGNPNGCTYINNQCINFSEESIAVKSGNVYTNPCKIQSNFIDYKLTDGQGTYGIRAEANNLEIINNTIFNSVQPILCYAYDEVVKYENWKIYGNTINLNNKSSSAIFVQGNPSNSVVNANITNNTVIGSGLSLTKNLQTIVLANSEKSSIGNNNIFLSGITKNGFTVRVYSVITTNNNTRLEKGTIAGTDYDVIVNTLGVLDAEATNTNFKIIDYLSTAEASADIAVVAAGANPTKAEFDALVAELHDLKAKMRTATLLAST